MSSLNEKMTALADEIRELSGTTTSKSIDAMTSDVDAANAEISEQMGLIAQITTALEGKAGGTTSEDLNAELTEYASLNTEFEEVINSLPNAGGGGTGGNIETCTVTINFMEGSDYCYAFLTTLENSVETGTRTTTICVTNSSVVTNVVKNSDLVYLHSEACDHSETIPYSNRIDMNLYFPLYDSEGFATTVSKRQIETDFTFNWL